MISVRSVLSLFLLLSTAALAQIPSHAVSSGNLDNSTNWMWEHDDGTPGTSVGTLAQGITSPSLDGQADEFTVAYSQYGGERYHLLFGYDTNATYFVYHTWVYLTDPAQVQNLELDMNQVLANGETIIMGTQCSSLSGTWEYTYVSNGQPHWHASNIACNPQSWAANKWHHIQIQFHRQSATSDVLVHDWVKFDNSAQKSFRNAVGASGLFLNWGIGDLLVNFQLDGASANNGNIVGYFDEMQVYRW